MWLVIQCLQDREGIILFLIWTHFLVCNHISSQNHQCSRSCREGQKELRSKKVDLFFFFPLLFWQTINFRKVARIIVYLSTLQQDWLLPFCHILSIFVWLSLYYPQLECSPINLQHSCSQNESILTNNHNAII